MASHVIDLRKKDSNVSVEARVSEHNPENSLEKIEWSAFEYEPRERSSYWFLGLGAFALLFILIGIISKNYFFVALIALAYMVLVMYAKRSPSKITFSIAEEGVGIGKELYRFSDLTSFWIFESVDKKILSLETKKTFRPFLHIHLAGVSSPRVKMFLSRYLSEKEHQEFVSDEVAKLLGF